MKINSIVTLKKEMRHFKIPFVLIPHVKKLPTQGELYIVRDVVKSKFLSDKEDTGIMVEEFVVGSYGDIEIALNVEMFREVQPPMEVDINQLLSEGNVDK